MTREKLSALRHKGYITDAEYKEIISALEQKPSDNGMAVMPTHCKVCGKPLGVFDGQICAECQKPCDDAISRQAVLEQINCWIGNGEYRYTNATHYLTERVKHISSVTQSGKWIPVSERLPEDDDLYLITFDDGEIDLVTFDRGAFSYSGVIAWMPLPKPYEPQERSEKE